MSGYMNNKENFKGTFSNLSPSDECMEKICNIATENKKVKGFVGYKRLASAMLAFAILVTGSGLGANAVIKNKKSNQSFGVIVAYADEQVKIIRGTRQKVRNGLYFAPADDEKECEKQYKKAKKDYNEMRKEIEGFDENEPYQLRGILQTDICDENNNVQGKLYSTQSGFFVADVNDFTNVKSMTVENKSPDGFIQLEWSGLSDLLENQKEETVDKDNPYSLFINHKLTLTGDQLRESQNSFGKYAYEVIWVSAYEYFEAYGTNYKKDYKASDIKDKITFTFEYEDGTKQSTSIDISFDDYGHMIVS